jgi:hypothetical protein
VRAAGGDGCSRQAGSRCSQLTDFLCTASTTCATLGDLEPSPFLISSFDLMVCARLAKRSLASLRPLAFFSVSACAEALETLTFGFVVFSVSAVLQPWS